MKRQVNASRRAVAVDGREGWVQRVYIADRWRWVVYDEKERALGCAMLTMAEAVEKLRQHYQGKSG